jgi:hypothetical protein
MLINYNITIYTIITLYLYRTIIILYIIIISKTIIIDMIMQAYFGIIMIY